MTTLDTWQIKVTYKGKEYEVRADLLYKSDKYARIHVHGSRSAIMLDTRLPEFKWEMTGGILKDKELLDQICKKLENKIAHG